MPKKPSASILPFLSVERSAAAGIGNQIYNALRRAIDDGVLRSGFRLPSSRELARQTGVGRNSVHDAYQRLIVEGFLRGRSGSGTYVVGPAVTVRATRSRVTLSRWAARHLHETGRPSLNQPFAATAAADDEFSWPRWLQLVSAGWRSWRNATDARQETHGLKELRIALAEHAAVICGISCDPDEILIGTGGDRLITAVARLVADPGDAVLIDDASDRAARFLFELIGLRCVEAGVDHDGLDVERAQSAEARLAFLRPSAEGPCGVVMSPGRRYAVMAWAKAHALPVIEDDFDSIVDPPAQGLKPLKSLDTKGVCIYVADLSRALMPGVSISFAIAPPSIVDACRAARLLPLPPPVGEQLALAAFVSSSEFSRQIARMRGAYNERREALIHELRRQLSGGIVSIERRGPLQVIVRLSDELRDVTVAEAAATMNLDIAALSLVAPEEQGLILGYGGTQLDRLPNTVNSLAEAFEMARRQAETPTAANS